MVAPEASHSLPVRVKAGGGRRWLSAIPVQEVDRDQRVALTGLVREALGSRPSIPLVISPKTPLLLLLLLVLAGALTLVEFLPEGRL